VLISKHLEWNLTDSFKTSSLYFLSNKNIIMNKKNYWKKNIQYLSILLTIWFVIGTLCSLVFVNELNSIKIGAICTMDEQVG